MMTRRTILAILVGGAGAVVGGGAWLAHTASLEQRAIEAWRSPGAGERDPRRFALAHAILAPNPHNRQPWLVDLLGDDALLLYADLERLLPVTDPFDRQIIIGCGAFLELLAIAAAELGLRAEITLFPDGAPEPRLDERPVAHVRFQGDASPDPLFAHILDRRSNKEAYDPSRSIAATDLARVAGAAKGAGLDAAAAGAGPVLDAVKALIPAAYRREFATPAALQESVDLIRVGGVQIEAHRDGIDLGGPLMEALRLAGQMSPKAMTTPGTPAYEQGLAQYDGLAASSKGAVWIVSDDNSRAAQIATGRAYVRANLEATRVGLAMHPMSQALQEYEAMADLKARADLIFGIAAPKRLQMLARIGYGPRVPTSPRRGLEAHLRV
jgi:hypothetical protein